MKKLLISCILSTVLAISFVGCSSSSTSTNTDNVAKSDSSEKKESTEKVDDSKTEEPAKTASKDKVESKEKPAKKDDKIDFKCDAGQLTYSKHEVSKDYEGKPAVVIYFDYTNLSDEASSSMLAFTVKPFQNGVECETAVITNDIKEIDNSMKEVKKDTTLPVAFAFVLDDAKADIELEVSELISFSDEKATQILKLK